MSFTLDLECILGILGVRKKYTTDGIPVYHKTPSNLVTTPLSLRGGKKLRYSQRECRTVTRAESGEPWRSDVDMIPHAAAAYFHDVHCQVTHTVNKYLSGSQEVSVSGR